MSESAKSEMHQFNRDIVAELIEDGANKDALFDIEHHFSAAKFEQLEKAAVAFFKEGLDVTDAEEFETDDGARIFSFDVLTSQPLHLDKLDEETNKMLELAEQWHVDYDGWGTYLEDEQD